jgi:AcrR family transcriptional regulator
MARPPSQASHQAIIGAFIKLIERDSIDTITTDAIAKAAGASKSTLYKHWADKEALLVEVIACLISTMPVANSGNFQADAVQVLTNMFVEHRDGSLGGRIWPKLFGYTATHPEMCMAIKQGLLKHAPQHSLVPIIQAAIAAGEFRPDLDLELALDLLAGPMMHHRFLYGRVQAPTVARVVAAVWPMLQSPGRRAAIPASPPAGPAPKAAPAGRRRR